MNCTKCGSLLTPGAPFCNICNEPAPQGNYVPYGQPPPTMAQPPYSYADYQQPAQGYSAYPEYPQSSPTFAQQQPMQAQPMQAPGQQPITGNVPVQQPMTGNMPVQPPVQPAAGASFQQAYPYKQPQSYAAGMPSPLFGGYVAQPPVQNALLGAIVKLPEAFVKSLQDPGAVLQGMMERRDLYSAPVVAFLSLLITFLCGMFSAKNLVKVVSDLISFVLRENFASVDGVNSIARSTGAMIGGIAALCHLLAIVIPLIVLMVYLCAVCKVRFSMELLSGSAAILTMPAIPFAILSILGNLLTPFLPLMFIVCASLASYILMGSIAVFVTMKTDQQLVSAKLVMTMTCFLLTFFAQILIVSPFFGHFLSLILLRAGSI